MNTEKILSLSCIAIIFSTTQARAQNFNTEVVLSEDSPQVKFEDTNNDDYWIHVNNNKMYFLWDGNDNDNHWGGDEPWPLVIDGRNSIFADSALYIEGNTRRVGVGSSSPQVTLDIAKPNETVQMLRVYSANGNIDQGKDFSIQSYQPSIAFVDRSGNANAAALHFNTSTLYFSDYNGLGSVAPKMAFNTETGKMKIGEGIPGIYFEVAKPNEATQMVKIQSANGNNAVGQDLEIQSFHPSIRFSDRSNGGFEGLISYNTKSFYFSRPNAAGEIDHTLQIDTENKKVGIGTQFPSHPLDVNGTIRAKEIIVESDWSDYVFEKDYHLAPLSEVEAHIEEKGHLPGMPSAAEIQQNGAKLSELVTMQMAKIEELTLHLIEKEKQLKAEKLKNEKQSEDLKDLRRSNASLTTKYTNLHETNYAILERLEALEN